MTKLPYKHTCQRCETKFRSKGPNNKYCSVECKKQTYFENSKLYTCKVCDSKFQGSKGNYNIFCSKKCYGSRMNTHPKEFGMAERSAKMRESRVSEVAWKKGIETRNGFYSPCRLPMYKDFKTSHLKNSNYLSKNIICLPFFTSLKEKEIKYIVKTFLNLKK